MKNILLGAFTMLSIGFAGCGNKNDQYPQEQNHVTVSPLSNNVDIQADKNASFDVNALSDIVAKSTDPKVLEQKINDPSTNINNMDLDKDGKVDYLTVTESGANQLEISDASVNPPVTVARLTVTPDNSTQTASLQINGTPEYCGSSYNYYRPSISFGEMLFMAYLLSPHSYYRPMYGYGHYPSYYTSQRTVVRTTYRPSTSQYVSRPSNAGSGRSSLGSPVRSQRSFGARDNSRPVGRGGFGNSSSRSSSPAPHMSSSPRRSFGRRR